MDTSILAPLGWGCRKEFKRDPKGFLHQLSDVVSLCVSTPADWPHSWRWSVSERVWGVWAGCRACCSSECTRDSGDHLWPPSAAVCCCCTRTEQEQVTFVRMQSCVRAEFRNPEEPVKSRDKVVQGCSDGTEFPDFQLPQSCSVLYLIKYTEFLLWLTLHVLSFGLKICAGRLFHCWREEEEDRKSLNQLSLLKNQVLHILYTAT